MTKCKALGGTGDCFGFVLLQKLLFIKQSVSCVRFQGEILSLKRLLF